MPRCGKSAAALFSLLCLVLSSSWGFSADRYWVDTGSGSGSWSDPANWSSLSGGVGGSTPPGSSDRARFNSLRNGNCLLGSPVSVAGVLIEAGYSGVITQAANQAMTIGTQGFSQVSGTWVGNNAACTINGPFTLGGGSYIATSDILGISGSFVHVAGGIFTNSSGTLRLFGVASSIDVATSEALFNLVLAKNNSAALTIAASDSLVVQGLLTLQDGLVNQSTVPAAGSIVANGNVAVGQHSTVGQRSWFSRGPRPRLSPAQPRGPPACCPMSGYRAPLTSPSPACFAPRRAGSIRREAWMRVPRPWSWPEARRSLAPIPWRASCWTPIARPPLRSLSQAEPF